MHWMYPSQAPQLLGCKGKQFSKQANNIMGMANHTGWTRLPIKTSVRANFFLIALAEPFIVAGHALSLGLQGIVGSNGPSPWRTCTSGRLDGIWAQATMELLEDRHTEVMMWLCRLE